MLDLHPLPLHDLLVIGPTSVKAGSFWDTGASKRAPVSR